MSTATASPRHDTHGKALSLNLDASIYGTLAEIGAGQEVARWFLSVGAASGTVAKTISAYDKKVSDEIYGAGTRYVSRERLLAMLDREYRLLLERLSTTRGDEKRFFAFADTISARNYQGSNEQHGWLGIRFQMEPNAPGSQVLLHINLCDPTAQLQQQAIGILGVNLVYAAYHQRTDVDVFLAGLFDDLSIERIEIDVIEFDGPAFMNRDARAWCLALLGRHMSHAIVFDNGGRVVEPSSLLRKRPLAGRARHFRQSGTARSRSVAIGLPDAGYRKRAIRTRAGRANRTLDPSCHSHRGILSGSDGGVHSSFGAPRSRSGQRLS